MIKVYVKKQGNYPVSAVLIRKFLQGFLAKEGIYSDSYVSVALVGREKMIKLSKKYYPKDNNLHTVFSFVESEVSGFVYPKNKNIFLGEIIVCYPFCVELAKSENKLINDKLIEFIQHGAEHLLGRHHQ